jgi:hypothetical protein
MSMMESNDLNKALMEYLYGEMSNAEKKEFEALLIGDKELQKEYNELKNVREELAKLEDKEVMEPFSIWGHTRSGLIRAGKHRRSIVLRPIIAVAATLILLMLVGYATDFSLRLNGQGFSLSFNKQEASVEQVALTEDDVKRILADEIENNNARIAADLSDEKELVDARLVNLESIVEKQKKKNKDVVRDEDLQKFLTSVKQQNTEMLQQYLSQASTQQQEYFKTMLTQFNDYLQEQRVEDLNMVQSGLLEMKYSQTQQKLETDQAIAKLFTTVGSREN